MTTETQETATPAARKTGSQVIGERFPEHRALWQFVADKSKGFSSPFTMTALLIQGRVVLLQEFGEDRGHSWDVYVAASDSAEIAKTLGDLEAILAGQPVECRTKQCDYYTHYLAYGPADLTHEGFHEATKHCIAAQKRLMEWYDAHPNGQAPEHLMRFAGNWEARVRA